MKRIFIALAFLQAINCTAQSNSMWVFHHDSLWVKNGPDSTFIPNGRVFAFAGITGLNISGKPVVPSDTASTIASKYKLDSTVTAINAAVGLKLSTVTAAATYQLIGNYSLTSHTHAYNTLTAIPATFTPSAHTHLESEITNLVNDLAAKLATNGSAANLTNFPTFNQNTSGTAAGLSAVLSFANGGIGAGAATTATTGTMTVTMNTEMITITPSGACTFNASGGVTGQRITFVITTSGTTSFVLTFGTNFKSTATLATGTTTAKIFAVSFLCTNGTQWVEFSRTAAQ